MEQFKLREIENDENFDPNDIGINVPFTQANFYGEWQKSLGRAVKRFTIYNNKETIAYFQLVKYPLLGNKNYLYTPYGPVTKDFSKEFFNYIKKEITGIAKNEKAIFVRLDFTPVISNELLSNFFTKSKLYTYHSAYFQPRVEWFLELNKSEDELLKNMHEKTRYSIRLSEKKKVTAEIITKDFEKYFEIFYELMSTTAKRNSFSIHEKKYYKNIFQNLSKRKNGYLSITKFEQEILVINLIIVFGGVANYVFGSSSNKERNRMPTYLAQWRAICHAKQISCDYYNFGGITTKTNTYKGWDGLTVFKKKFGGQEVKHSDFFDIVISPFWYYFYNLRKRLKKFRL